MSLWPNKSERAGILRLRVGSEPSEVEKRLASEIHSNLTEICLFLQPKVRILALALQLLVLALLLHLCLHTRFSRLLPSLLADFVQRAIMSKNFHFVV